MNPITHYLVGWVALERRVESARDKALVCLAGLAPDLDGLGILVDAYTRFSDLPETSYYQDYHRMLGHGLPAAVAFAIAAAAMARSRMRVAVFAFVAVHLHFLCDLLGSRGSTPEDLWPIHYLEPVSGALVVTWPWQWPLVSWQNMLISIALLAVTFKRATEQGYSPLHGIHTTADLTLVAVLRKWRSQLNARFRTSR
ncbi:metal-dependent hydrolase [Ahniella affigens]|uniref:metal-dependent hydrolase n=1 Tax=Ahniella affigens TaxID=2021234 RepID=UPI0014751D8D|nr:metal-dependent hydrolase [Ahniella affigens]